MENLILNILIERWDSPLSYAQFKYMKRTWFFSDNFLAKDLVALKISFAVGKTTWYFPRVKLLLNPKMTWKKTVIDRILSRIRHVTCGKIGFPPR
jgi:hypothetical protein